MVKKYRIGTPFNTEAVVKNIELSDIESFPLELSSGDKLVIKFPLDSGDIIFGLGEAVRGINKRGWIYESWCSDETNHTEDNLGKVSIISITLSTVIMSESQE